MSFYNPFKNMIETQTFPHARTLRTTFKQKILDAFLIFSGSFFDEKNVNHVGLFDYCTFFIPYVLGKVLFKRINNFDEKEEIQVSTVFLILLTIFFTISRYLFSSISTLVSLPIIAIVHAFSLIEGSRLKEKALKFKSSQTFISKKGNQKEDKFYKFIPNEDESKTLDQYLKKEKLNFEDLFVVPILTKKVGGPIKSEKLTLDFYKNHEKKKDAEFSYSVLFKEEDNNQEAKKMLKPILKLNMGGITAKLGEGFGMRVCKT